jgi:hypothetical protein
MHIEKKSRNIGALHNVSIARQQETNLFYLSILLIRVNIESAKDKFKKKTSNFF